MVLVPYRITPLSNNSAGRAESRQVLVPYRITPLSNVQTYCYRVRRVLVPYRITPLSNCSPSMSRRSCVLVPYRITPLSNLKLQTLEFRGLNASNQNLIHSKTRSTKSLIHIIESRSGTKIMILYILYHTNPNLSSKNTKICPKKSASELLELHYTPSLVIDL